MKEMMKVFVKGQRFETSYNQEIYAYAGKWSGSMVLAPENDENTEVLIYTENEVYELIETGELRLITGQEMVIR